MAPSTEGLGRTKGGERLELGRLRSHSASFGSPLDLGIGSLGFRAL